MVIGKLELALLRAVGIFGIRLHLREDKDAGESRKTFLSSPVPVSGSGIRDDFSRALPKDHKVLSQNAFVEENRERAGWSTS